MNRPGLRAVLSEKFLEVFGWYEAELETVQKIYESQKVSKIFTGLINGWRVHFVYIVQRGLRWSF